MSSTKLPETLFVAILASLLLAAGIGFIIFGRENEVTKDKNYEEPESIKIKFLKKHQYTIGLIVCSIVVFWIVYKVYESGQ